MNRTSLSGQIARKLLAKKNHLLSQKWAQPHITWDLRLGERTVRDAMLLVGGRRLIPMLVFDTV